MFHGIEPQDAETFERQLRYLTRNYDVVPLAQLLQRKVKLKHEIALTFDDGLRNNFTVAYPILRKLSLPATFFVCPALIDSGSWLWNHEARARLNSIANTEFITLAKQTGAPIVSVDSIVEWMKGLYKPEKLQVEQAIREATPSFQKSPEQGVRFDMMNWSELAALDQDLIAIGSHTVSHPILSTLDEKELEQEVAESRVQLEAKLGRPVPHFCYPNGSHNPAVVASVRRHYQAAVTTDAALLEGQVDPHLLPRIPWAPSLPMLAWRMWRPTA
jgi:peptidoglycan/xylan/chitin deacetylase (PgdA/CDA1 family)